MEFPIRLSLGQEMRIPSTFVGTLLFNVSLHRRKETIRVTLDKGRVQMKKNTLYYDTMVKFKVERLDETTPYTLLMEMPQHVRMQMSTLESDHPYHEISCQVQSKKKLTEEEVYQFTCTIFPPRADINRLVIHRNHTVWVHIHPIKETVGGLLLIPRLNQTYTRYMFRILYKQEKHMLFLENATEGLEVREPVGIHVNHMGWIGLLINQELKPITKDGDESVEFIQCVLEHAMFKYVLD